MAQNNEAQSESQIQSAEKNPQPDTLAAKKMSPKHSFFGLPFFSMALATIALLLGVYAIYMTHYSHQLRTQQTNLEIDTLKKQQSADNESINSLEETVSKSQTNLQGQVEELEKKLQTAVQQSFYQKQDWHLLKARYYLELAQINAHWSNEQQATIALLQQADALLANDSNHQLFPVRQAIAEEISQLQALPKLDLPGLLSQLDAAQNSLRNLSLKQPLNKNADNYAAETRNPGSSSWQERLKSSMTVLEKLVIIRHNDKDIKPLLSPLHQVLLRDSIQLKLQEAEWAVMQNSPKIYQLALARALQDIKRSFDENSPATQTLIKHLQSLQQEKLIPARASIEKSLPLLNQLIEKKNSQPPKPVAPVGGKTP
ncbi:MAG: uroporphyrinogen-III C-methyltransferase [Tatlockia sp.]|nr:uroporphyrinogen-III C-methyltransferase [Tatlockia sp.]